MEINSYQDLRVWQDGMEIAQRSYLLTKSFPKDELFGMVSQIRRAAVSVPATIAEGYGRDNLGSYIQFLRIAQGSLKELETHLILAERVGLAKAVQVNGLLDQCGGIGKMLRSLIRSLESQPKK